VIRQDEVQDTAFESDEDGAIPGSVPDLAGSIRRLQTNPAPVEFPERFRPDVPPEAGEILGRKTGVGIDAAVHWNNDLIC
jgi:hypothetical protein